jgi:hypothetical protein
MLLSLQKIYEMSRFILLVIMILSALPELNADNIKDLTARLEQELNCRQKYLQAKVQRIDSLSMLQQHAANAEQVMNLYELLFN